MPSFYPSTMPHQIPPTPPDHFGPFAENSGYGSGHMSSLQSAPYHTPASRYEFRSHEDHAFAKQYSQYTGAPMPQPAYLPDQVGHAPTTYSAPMHSSSSTYGPLAAPLLPPIQVPDQSLEDYQRRVPAKRVPPVSQVKEEKIGGVAAHLDYEMDDMVDFVAEMTQGIVVSSKSPVHPDFRKYVSQVLSSTRLPSSTILISLYYLARRMTLLSAEGKYSHIQRDIYPMLTTALLLGSKFLDDNTFQNRSWSEVSNISVKELNMLEIEWLLDIDWKMHVDPNDPEGFALWRRHWKRFQDNKADMSLAESMQKTHIDFKPQQPSSQHRATALPTRYAYSRANHDSGITATDHSQSQWNAPPYEKWPLGRLQINYSPPSAPETGPNTPDSYGMHSGFGYGHPATHYSNLKLPPVSQMMPPNVAQPDIFALYQQSFSQFGHGTACGCSYCRPGIERFSMAHTYGIQPVAG